jgi:multimeric flavodoxin WrbA
MVNIGREEEKLMRVLVLNGSPRKNGTVETLLGDITEGMRGEHQIDWIDVCKLNIENCTGCMACRSKGVCVLPKDDGHIVGKKIDAADALVIGTPVYWGNMCAPLKQLFDRNVPVFMDESPKGMPVPRQKGKKVVLATACTSPWPINFILPESRGALRALREVLHYGGYKISGSVVKPGTKSKQRIPERLHRRARRLGRLLTQ